MKITKSTIVRTFSLILVIVNFALERAGLDIIKTDESAILMLVEGLISVAVVLVGFWKNNSFTEKAIKADNFLRKLKESE